ncbi:MAG: C40 family peptidase, partial [Ignavibacteriae bacterium]|nr:C40 family peptidase [Ignavibacteriota bacterium]
MLIIKNNLTELKNEMVFNFPKNLACANLIGIDKHGNIFVVVEKYMSEIPLQVERQVYTISKNGNILSRLLLPNIKYLYTLKDLQIDADGNLYQLLSYTDKVEIIKWENLTIPTYEIITYPHEYAKEIHFNDYTPTEEVTDLVQQNLGKTNSGVSRTEALRIADKYVLHQYICSSSNLAPSNVTAPDGDVVRTPDWLMEGINARIPYKWGGFNTIDQFDAGMLSGKYAGDIHTNGVSSYAVGVDCSGYVSRCWNMDYHASTRYMPNITTQYDSWDDLKPGDAVHKIGHVRLFVEREVNGNIKIVEATGRGWGVSYWSYSVSDLSSYTPRYYNNMENNYNAIRPTLVSAKVKAESIVSLKWSCDTTGVLGYRIYGSEDGSNWDMISEVNDNTTKDLELNNSGIVKYFRISSVKNNSPDYSESNWSNVMGVGYFASEKNVLILDGFQRESGSWQGAGHTFVSKYGQALTAESINFNSAKNTEIQNASFKLEDYDYVFWILGDESTVDETFNSTEQALVENYLENGGNLFVSGSEVGWDLDYKGSEKDKSFYNNYLKANYIS